MSVGVTCVDQNSDLLFPIETLESGLKIIFPASLSTGNGGKSKASGWWCLAVWRWYGVFLFHLQRGNITFLFSSKESKEQLLSFLFGHWQLFLFSSKKIKWKNHLVQRISGLHKTMSASIIVAEPIISNLITLYVIMSYNSSKSMLNVFKLDFKWSPHVDTTICAVKICW